MMGSGCIPALGGTQAAKGLCCLFARTGVLSLQEKAQVTTWFLFPSLGIASWRTGKKVMMNFAPVFLSLAA